MRDRLDSETEEKKAARLQRMSANQRHRLATETEEDWRAARLQRMRDRLDCAAALRSTAAALRTTAAALCWSPTVFGVCSAAECTYGPP